MQPWEPRRLTPACRRNLTGDAPGRCCSIQLHSIPESVLAQQQAGGVGCHVHQAMPLVCPLWSRLLYLHIHALAHRTNPDRVVSVEVMMSTSASPALYYGVLHSQFRPQGLWVTVGSCQLTCSPDGWTSYLE